MMTKISIPFVNDDSVEQEVTIDIVEEKDVVLTICRGRISWDEFLIKASEVLNTFLANYSTFKTSLIKAVNSKENKSIRTLSLKFLLIDEDYSMQFYFFNKKINDCEGICIYVSSDLEVSPIEYL